MNILGQHSNMKSMNKACIVGGNWNNSSNAGPFCANVNNTRSNSNDNVSGRDCSLKPDTTIGRNWNTGVCCPAISEIKKERSFSSKNIESQTSKKIGYLFEKAFTKENLYLAYLDARKGKRKKRATLNFEKSLWNNIEDLYLKLHNGIYRPRPYLQFMVYEPKPRVINAPAFRDLVVQHAIYRVIYPIFNKTFIHSSYACRKGGGTHKASSYTQAQMKKYSGELYFLKLDIKKFFYSIDRTILRKFFENKIKDERFIDVMCEFIEMNTKKGIPIGNLLSQIYALIYLNKLDHFILRNLKVNSYVRYVDDFILIGLTLNEAKDFKEKIETFVKEKLNLELSHWHIQKIKRGINFVGYRTWKRIKFVRKHSMYKMKKAIKKMKLESIISLIGHAKGTATIKYYRKLLIEFSVFNLLPNRSQKCLFM